VRNKRVWERACGLTETVVEGVDFDEVSDAIVVSVRPTARARSWPVWSVPSPSSSLRRWRGTSSVAGVGSGHDEGVRRGSGAAGAVS
jgi:hypothetical protein